MNSCAFKPGCLMSRNWLHTLDCKVFHSMNLILWLSLATILVLRITPATLYLTNQLQSMHASWKDVDESSKPSVQCLVFAV